MKSIMLLGLLVIVLSLMGCVTNMGPGGAAPGVLGGSVTYPNKMNDSMRHRVDFQKKDIDILGSVSAEGTSYGVLGMVSWGDSGYGELLKKAKTLGGEGVMNVTVDTNFTEILYGVLYYSLTNKLNGVAYKYKK